MARKSRAKYWYGTKVVLISNSQEYKVIDVRKIDDEWMYQLVLGGEWVYETELIPPEDKQQYLDFGAVS